MFVWPMPYPSARTAAEAREPPAADTACSGVSAEVGRSAEAKTDHLGVFRDVVFQDVGFEQQL